eukprot:gene16172-biopygen13565
MAAHQENTGTGLQQRYKRLDTPVTRFTPIELSESINADEASTRKPFRGHLPGGPLGGPCGPWRPVAFRWWTVAAFWRPVAARGGLLAGRRRKAWFFSTESAVGKNLAETSLGPGRPSAVLGGPGGPVRTWYGHGTDMGGPGRTLPGIGGHRRTWVDMGGHWWTSLSPFYAAPSPFYASPVPFYASPVPFYAAPVPFYASPVPFHASPVPFYASPVPFYASPIPFYASPGSFYASHPLLH